MSPGLLSLLPPIVIELGELEFTNGVFQFTLSGEVGKEYVIQSSSNLVQWDNLTNIVYGETFADFSEIVTNHPAHFFRAYKVE